MKRSSTILGMLFSMIVFCSQSATAVDIFLSEVVTTGSGVTKGAPNIDLSAIGNGNTGSLGIWVDLDGLSSLQGISLNLVSNTPGAIAFSNSPGTAVPNPTVSGGTRWFEDEVPGFNVESISDDSLMNIIGVSLNDSSNPNSGRGLGISGDSLFDSPYYLFATVDYTVLDSNSSTQLFLQIGEKALIDSGDAFVTSIAFGNDTDPALDSSMLSNRGLSTATAEATLSGSLGSNADFDNDGDVDGTDFLAWQAGFGGAGGLAQGDADGNGTINGLDLAIWKNQYGLGFGSGGGSLAGTAVPEPSSLVLQALAVLAIAASGYSRRIFTKWPQ